MKKVLVLGSKGQLGEEIKRLHTTVNYTEFTFTHHETLDITNTDLLKNIIQSNTFDYVINCAAYTAVDKAEEEKDMAYKINSQAVAVIGNSTNKINAKVVHVSTDYVYDGTSFRPYIETDNTSPQSVYGHSKLEGEKELLANNPDSIIIRTSWLYSTFRNNFVKTMIRLGNEREELGVIYDQIGTPTYAADLAETILHIIKSDIEMDIPFAAGIYHYSNEGVTSWYDFALAIHHEKQITCKVKPIETKDYPTPAQRPHYSVLNKSKIKKQYKIDIPHWLDSLKKCLNNINE